MRFLEAILWEFIQNLPFITGFVTGLSLWQQDKQWAAAACALAGSVIGSLIIRITESKIVQGQREPLRVTVANIVVVTVLTLALVAYLSAQWSNWKTDLFFGVVAGIGIAAAQGLAAGESVGVRHCVALGLSAPIGLVGTKILVATLPALASILIVTAVATLIIGLIDYGPSYIRRTGPEHGKSTAGEQPPSDAVYPHRRARQPGKR